MRKIKDCYEHIRLVSGEKSTFVNFHGLVQISCGKSSHIWYSKSEDRIRHEDWESIGTTRRIKNEKD